MRRLVQLEAAQTLLIDASQGESFLIQMATSIQTLRLKNVIPGQLYLFMLVQNQAGGHRITWGSQVLNAEPADPAPHSITVQSCIASTGGILLANIPGSWK